MKFFGGIRRIIKPFVDVPRWIGYRQLVKNSQSLHSFARKFFISEQSDRQETFETALTRLNLTEADLVRRTKEFTRLMWLWIFLFVATLFYSIHLLLEDSLRGFFPCLGVSFVILTQVFRYHFWIFQIKYRRLGCSFRDWLGTAFVFKKREQ